MQPAALLLPARVSMTVQSLFFSIFTSMSAALAVSLELNDISLMLSMIGVESYLVASTCLTVFFNKSFFDMDVHRMFLDINP